MPETVKLVTGGVAKFWSFFATREAARLRKESGEPRPHSDDPILVEWRFCNVYRELDRGTVFFAKHRSEDAMSVLWESVAYRLINRRETFEAVSSAGCGELWKSPETLSSWISWLSVKMFEGMPIFTGRHIVRGLGPYELSLRWLADNLQVTTDKICSSQAREGGLQYICDVLSTIPGVGPFFAWQIARDLVEAGAVPEDDTWALAGPGARRGAALVVCSEKTSQKEALAIMIALRDHQSDAAGVLMLDRRSWFRVPVNLADIEHALCEFARYETIKRSPYARAKCGRYAI